MRTRGKGEGLIEHKENMRFGWALPNTRCLQYPHISFQLLSGYMNSAPLTCAQRIEKSMGTSG